MSWSARKQVLCKLRSLGTARSIFRRSERSALSTPYSSSREWSSGFFSVHREVAHAVQAGEPVVALETTILTHGMPHPQNIETALAVEEVVREVGAVPASIGVLDGTVHVGLTASRLERLASLEEVQKISQRDLAYCVSEGYSGGTTVSGTMVCACKAGIHVFVTGGIGGVHRGGENTLDISADLATLGRTPVAVVCAGVKSILDIGRTLEYLETQGVPVLTLGHDSTFPAFFTPDSGHKAPHHVKSPLDAARVIEASLELSAEPGIVIGVPPNLACNGHVHPDTPPGDLGQEIEAAIQQALKEASKGGVSGKEITPFVLQRVNQLTGGKSLKANIELIRSNARVGGEIAVELARLRSGTIGGRRGNTTARPLTAAATTRRASDRKGGVVVLGGSVLDFTAKITSPQILKDGTNPGCLGVSFGGVGRNIAECLSRVGRAPLLISAVGKDQNGKLVCDHLTNSGLALTGVRVSEDCGTGTYCVVVDHQGEVFCGIGDMDVTTQITPEWVQGFQDDIKQAAYVCIDGNITEETMEYVLNLCSTSNIPVWFEPTCVLKACKPFLINCHGHITTTSPNLLELRHIHHSLTAPGIRQPSNKAPSELSLDEKVSECKQLVPDLLSHIPTVIVSLGKDGVLHCSRQQAKLTCLHYRAASSHMMPARVLNVSGAGDSFVGAMLAGICSGLTRDLSVKAGLNAAFLSLSSATAISQELCPGLLEEKNISKWAPWNASNI